jgi:hypothetical protein
VREPKKRQRQPNAWSDSSQWCIDPHYLVFVREGILVGQRFDLATEHTRGEPFSIAEPVDYFFSTARAMFATSRKEWGHLYRALTRQGRLTHSGYGASLQT